MRLERAGDDAIELVPRECAEPVARGGQVLISVEACGVCRTDLHLLEGEVKARLPVVPGHQIAGRVVEVGPGVDSLDVGQMVGVGWLHSTCGACRFCTTGRENLCEQATFTGRDVDGGYAERVVADARFAYGLPEGLSAIDAAPLLCAGVIGYRSLRVSGIQPGGKLGLIGFGSSAHLAIQVARYWGCEVYAFAREGAHRRLARELGAIWAGDAAEDPGVRLDAAVIFAPAGELVPRALELLDRGGTLAINAIHMTPIPSLSYDALYYERTVRSVANFARQDAVEFLALAAEIPARARTERFRLEDAGVALSRIKVGDVQGAAVLEIA